MATSHPLFSVLVGAAALSLSAPPLRAQDPAVDHWSAVHPIFAARCFECHAGERRKGGLSLGTRDGLLRGGSSGAVITAGDAGKSRLIELVTSTDPFERMPPEGAPLSEDEVEALREWIDAGAPWGITEHDANTYSAPLALLEPAGADASTDPGAANLIDARLGAAPAGGLASDAEFARRVHLDVIGLLPSPAALAAFLADDAPGKRAALVEALLSDDTGYAEHWMSFWNDLLRNDFQGTGYIDGGRSQITAWLFDALAQNMPYDAFVRELIAPSSAAAEGFIKGIVWRGDNVVVQRAPMQAAVNVSQVFLGVNLKCAACHDSFVSDWSLAQTFALANCFSETPLSLTRCDTDLGVPAEYGFLWPTLGDIDGAAPRAARMARVAELVTARDNGYFTRTIVNRLWALLMGRGLVEPLDELEREPWDPALLDGLARDFIERGYDLRALLRTILTSDAYQRRSVATPEVAEAGFVFQGPSVRRMTAEQFYDALGSVTGAWQAEPRFELPPPRDTAAAARAEGVVRAWRVPFDPLSKALGRTAREQVTTRRETAGTTMQALELANGATLDGHLRRGAEALRATWQGSASALVDGSSCAPYSARPATPSARSRWRPSTPKQARSHRPASRTSCGRSACCPSSN
ncbi:MAG: DUF1549 domain-containing protein [Planctomycetota bacterium]